MPVIDFILDALAVIENIFSAAILSLLTYMIAGGWQYVFRAVSFFFDTQLVKLIGTVFSYFTKLINFEMFDESLVDALLKNVYIFVGVIMFFRLLMVVLKYLITPDLVNDAKTGVTSLVQRVILGCCGILFIPTIFNLANEFQIAILTDGLIQRIIIPSDMVEQMEEKIDQGGSYIGTYVLAGFLSPNSNATQKDVKQFDLGIKQGDLSSVEINEGGFLTQKFKYDYFFFISTLALAYVFYYMLKYCIDIAGRCFKLLLYKIMTPIAMVEYMINGSQDGMFKQWLSASLSTYFMLFVRILAIWFVLLVTTLMGDNSSGYAGTLLTENDYFLRAIIIIALLGFMMDLPKLVGQLFGLDLEQEGSASGVLKQVGGMLKGAAIGGLAIGGAAAAGGLSMAKGGLQNLQKAGHDAGGLRKLAGNTGNSIKDGIKNRAAAFKADPKGNLKNLAPGKIMHKASELTGKMNESEFGGKMNATQTAILGAALGSNQFTKAAYGGWESEQGEESKARAKAKEEARHQQIVGNQQQQIENQEFQGVMNLAARILDSGQELTPAELAVRTKPAEVGALDASVNGQMVGALAATITASDIQADGSLSAPAQTRVQQEVEQVVTRTFADKGISATPEMITQTVQKVMDTTQASVDATGTVSLKVDTTSVSGTAIGLSDQTITQVVNQVQGTKVNAEMVDLTQNINQNINRVATNTEEMNVYAEITTEHVERMRQDVSQSIDIQRNISDSISQSVDIQRDIRTNTEETAVWTELTAETSERTANTLSNLDNGSGISRRSDREIPRNPNSPDE